MKQNITVEQLNELSSDNKSRWIKWLMSHLPDGDYSFTYTDEDQMYAKLSTIGQMIEFLDDVDIDIRLKEGKLQGISYINGNREHIELRDALWQAVKEKLNDLSQK